MSGFLSWLRFCATELATNVFLRPCHSVSFGVNESDKKPLRTKQGSKGHGYMAITSILKEDQHSNSSGKAYMHNSEWPINFSALLPATRTRHSSYDINRLLCVHTERAREKRDRNRTWQLRFLQKEPPVHFSFGVCVCMRNCAHTLFTPSHSHTRTCAQSRKS